MTAVDLGIFATIRPDDLSGVEAAGVRLDDVMAVVAKTEGNGCVNDFSRMLAAAAWEPRLPPEAVTVFSGGTEGVLSPHVLSALWAAVAVVSGLSLACYLLVGSLGALVRRRGA